MAAPFWEGTDLLLITINTYRVPYLESYISAPNTTKKELEKSESVQQKKEILVW
jgi:hypothetical protein